MPNVIVCYKWVLDERDIYVKPETLDLDISRAKSKISDYDRNAIEEGVRIFEQYGGSVKALTYGTANAKASLKDVLSRGPEEAYWIGDESATTADSYVTANVLAAALKKIGTYDIIICAEGSADSYSQQVGPRIAALLGIEAVTFANSLEWREGKLVARRKLENVIEVAVITGPVVVSILPEINEPRLPGLKQVLAAGKKPSSEFKVADLDLDAVELQPKNRKQAIKGAVFNRKNIKIKEDNMSANVNTLVHFLKKENVL
ncbi:MAG: electron transfer flavoprotein subunit beta/FixA family protein [Negativicutes bacterium]|nr:electron transfer flavoprotein subunit beta/FixA family protein [Negativicutes bacterium]